MATRNLARTVVEGGQSSYAKWFRRLQNRVERRMRFDEEGNVVAGRPGKVQGKDFRDRLQPLERWLARHVGHGWDNVYREFCRRFDKRTVKGWHLDDHLRVMITHAHACRSDRFFVDERGIIRRRPRRRRKGDRGKMPEHEARARSWAAGRQVIVHGEALFWTARIVDPEVGTSPQGPRLSAADVETWSAFPPEARHVITYAPEAARIRALRSRHR